MSHVEFEGEKKKKGNFFGGNNFTNGKRERKKNDYTKIT